VQRRHEKFFSSSAGPNVVERAAVLPDGVAQRERWAKLAKRTTAELDGRPAQIGRHPNERPHATPARVAEIVARLPRRTDQILDLCAAYTGQRRRPATPLEGHPAGS
jgi:hypothetical protein